MGNSPALTKHPASRHIMSALSFIAPILDIAQNDFVQSKVEEAAKLFYNNANVTINLVPALVGGGLLLILLVPLLALLFQPSTEPLHLPMEPRSTDRTRATRTSGRFSPT